VILTAIILLIFGFVDWTEMQDGGEELVCPMTLVLIAAIQVGVGLLLMAICTVGLWKVEDNLWIKQELKYSLSLGLPLFVLIITTYTVSHELSLLFIFLALFCSHFIIITIPLIISLKWERRYSRHSIRVVSVEHDHQHVGESLMTGIRRDLLDVVLENQILSASLEHFCAKSFCIESVLFLKAVKRFVRDYDPEKAQRIAEELETKFLTRDSNSEINVLADIIVSIVEAIHEHNVTKEIFWPASRSVHDSLIFGPFEMWKQSAACKAAMREAKINDLLSLLNE